MFPDLEVSAYRQAVALFVNPVETLAALLLRNDVVGDSCCNFQWDYSRDVNENDVPLVSDFTSGEWFRLTEINVRQGYGSDVKVLSVVLTTDKTDAGTHTSYKQSHTFFTLASTFFLTTVIL